MGKFIVIDKEKIESILFDKLLAYGQKLRAIKEMVENSTELSTDESIEERSKQYPTSVKVHVFQAMTEQSLIEQMKAKEFAEWCSINEWYYSTASKGWHNPLRIHDFFTTEELFNQFTNQKQ